MSEHHLKSFLNLQKVSKAYAYGRKKLFAVQDIDLAIARGRTLGLVGESGCGKSTLGRLALSLERPTSGSVFFEGQDLINVHKSDLRHLRRKMQMVFQDPYAALNPRMTIEDCIGEGLDIHQLARGDERQQRILELVAQIGLDDTILQRYPHEFSGGQRQRISIARALAVEPQFLVCDEPISALDACTQQHIMQLLRDLKRRRQLTCLFISHDLHATRSIADEIAVMYLGRIVEKANADVLFNNPLHPYTKALLSAIPIPDPVEEKKRVRIILKGEPPSPINPPEGCPFHPRCAVAMPICRSVAPPLLQIGGGHSVACHAIT